MAESPQRSQERTTAESYTLDSQGFDTLQPAFQGPLVNGLAGCRLGESPRTLLQHRDLPQNPPQQARDASLGPVDGRELLVPKRKPGALFLPNHYVMSSFASGRRAPLLSTSLPPYFHSVMP